VHQVSLLSWSAAGFACVATALAAATASGQAQGAKYYLPDQAGSRIATVTGAGQFEGEVTVLTVARATNEAGPKETVKAFGEVYDFSPSFIALRRERPTQITFWNLQADDDHDFALIDAQGHVLMEVLLPPLKKTSFVFNFHREGLFPFKCLAHQPEMSGQFLVLPASTMPR